MSFRNSYDSWSDFKKNLFILLIIVAVGALVTAGFIFVDNVGVLLGWLLGSVVNIIAYITIEKGAGYLVETSGSESSKRGYLAIVFNLSRLILYAGALILSAFASFKWGSLSHGYCNLVSCALALMPTWITLLVVTFKRARHLDEPVKKEEAKPEEEEEK